MDANENITEPKNRPFNTSSQTTWKNMSPAYGTLNQELQTRDCLDNRNHVTSEQCVEHLTNQNIKNVVNEEDNKNVTKCVQNIDNENYNMASDMMIDSLNVNEGYQKLETRATLPKMNVKGKKKMSTWKDVSPNSSNENLVGKKMSDSFGSPKRSRSWDVSQCSNNQTVTWKDLSPSKVKGPVRSKVNRKKRPESGYYSNDVQSEGHDSREEFDSLSGSDHANSGRHSSSSSPDDAGFSEYYYDEDFTVKFDTNIKNSDSKNKEESGDYSFPPSLTGSYTRFGNIRESLSHPDLYFGTYESEFSGSRTSMEVSSSEREMMCSSDMLEFSNDPLFTPTPTGDSAGQTYSTDSLARDQNNISSRTSGDGKLTVDCCPRKDEYFLSFNSSSQGQSTASLSSNSYASQTSSQDGLATCSSNDGEEICSNSFHFCQATQGEEYSERNNVKYNHSKSGLDALQERSIEKSDSTEGRSKQSPKSSPKTSPVKSKSSAPKKTNLQPSKGTYGSLDGQQKLCGFDKQHSMKRVKNLTSWKQVKNLKKFGINGDSTERVHSMPDLCVQTSWGTNNRPSNEPRSLKEISDSFHNKRHSSSLLELYQRMKSPTSMVSLDTIKAVEQILFPDNSVNARSNSDCSSNSAESSFDGSSCCPYQEESRSSSRNGFTSPVRFISPVRTYSRSTGISQEKVTLWHGTKNFSSQFPPKTQDCGIQACLDDVEPIEMNDQTQQTSPNSHTEILTLLENMGTEHESRNAEKDSFQRKTTSEVRPKVKDQKSRRSTSSSPSRCHQPKYYNHRSLPDLSFLTPGPRNEFSSENSLFDPVKIPIILTPVVDDSRQTQSSQRESGYCSCHKDRRQGNRHFESSSSGVSFSSSSEFGCYNCRCSQGMTKDLERILFQPPHLECTHKYMAKPEAALAPQYQDHSNHDSHFSALAKKKSSRRMSSSGSSSSSSSLHLDKLYSVKEESPTSPEKPIPTQTVFDQNSKLNTYRGYHLSGNMEKRFHHDDYCDTNEDVDENSFSVEIEEDSNSHRKPLKSCLRKIDKGCRSRSMSNPDNLNAHLNETVKPPRKPNRYSIACDSLFPTGLHQGEEPKEVVKVVEPEIPTEVIEEVDSDVTVSQSSSTDEANKANKRVSFASEVLFQSPQPSPQVSPRRIPASAQVTNIEMKDEELRIEITEPVPPEKPKRTFAENPPVEFQVSPTLDVVEQQGSQELIELDRKIALLSNVIHAAETLVLHFAQAREPFEKLRLGSVAETPEVGTLVFKELCPAMEHVIEYGMKPHRSGVHVFGKIHITPWRIAEMSAELGPYTRSINDLVKKLKSRPSLLSNKQRFYAFIAGLLNLRLLDFWIGYMQTKNDLIQQVYTTESILCTSKTSLNKQFNNMIMAIQPLSALPFQLDYDIVAQTSGILNCPGEVKTDTKFENATDNAKSAVPKSVSDMEHLTSASKRQEPAGTSMIPKAKSFSTPVTTKPQEAPKKLSSFTGRKSNIPSRIPVGGSGQSKIPVSGSAQPSRIPKVSSKPAPINVGLQGKASTSNSPSAPKTTWAQQSPTRSPTRVLVRGEFVEQNEENNEQQPTSTSPVTVTGLTQKFIENRSLESSAGSDEKGEDSSSSLSMKAILDESAATTKTSGPGKQTIDITTLIDKLLLSNKPLPLTTPPSSNLSPVEAKTESSDSDTVRAGSTVDVKNLNKTDAEKMAESLEEIRDDILNMDDIDSEKKLKPASTYAVIEASPIMTVQMKRPDTTTYPDITKGCIQAELSLKRDDFRLTDFRYSLALTSYDSDNVDHLSYEEGDYLEVLAQLDCDWLYCAKGTQEGLVKKCTVQPISEHDEFNLMHNDFYH